MMSFGPVQGQGYPIEVVFDDEVEIGKILFGHRGMVSSESGVHAFF